jgi:hypothetical protein
MQHRQKLPEITSAGSETYVTSDGTLIESSLADADTSYVSGLLSSQLKYPVVVSPVSWHFKGPGHVEAANAAFTMVTASPEYQASSGRYLIADLPSNSMLLKPGENVGEPTRTILFAGRLEDGWSPSSLEVGEIACDLIERANQSFENQQTDIRMPMPPVM